LHSVVCADTYTGGDGDVSTGFHFFDASPNSFWATYGAADTGAK